MLPYWVPVPWCGKTNRKKDRKLSNGMYKGRLSHSHVGSRPYSLQAEAMGAMSYSFSKASSSASNAAMRSIMA